MECEQDFLMEYSLIEFDGVRRCWLRPTKNSSNTFISLPPRAAFHVHLIDKNNMCKFYLKGGNEINRLILEQRDLNQNECKFWATAEYSCKNKYSLFGFCQADSATAILIVKSFSFVLLVWLHFVLFATWTLRAYISVKEQVDEEQIDFSTLSLLYLVNPRQNILNIFTLSKAWSREPGTWNFIVLQIL